MAKVVVLAGGSPHAHDFVSIGQAWRRLLISDGHEVVLTDHPDRLPDLLDPSVDALVVSALYWQMTGDAYDQWRDEWGYTIPAVTRTAIADFVAQGGGLVANHTAPICFDDWHEWGEIVGCRWQWGVSSHLMVGPVRATIVGEHSIVDGLPAVLELNDEVYGDLWLAEGIHVLAVAKRTPDDADQPVLFTHHHGAGRVVFAGFGHSAASIDHLEHGALLRRAVAWVGTR